LADPEFITAVREFVGAIIEPGRVVSLAQALIKLTAPGVPDLYQGTELWMIRRARGVEANGCYQPLAAEGEHAEHVVAFGRGGKLVTIVPRLSQTLTGGWDDTTIALPDGTWRNVLTGEMHSGGGGGRERLDHLFARFPVALLIL